MSDVFIKTTEVEIGSDQKTVEVTAYVESGQITAGMNIKVELNSLLTILLPITQVIELGNNHVKLVVDCEDNDSAQMVMGLNFTNEALVVS